MKPRLDPAPVTPEDLAILGLCAACSTSRTNEHCFCSRYAQCDRRDADLMYMLTRVQMRETYDRQTWISGGPDGELITLRPAALIYVDAHLL